MPAEGERLAIDKLAFDTAQEACRSLLPSIPPMSSASPSVWYII
jgi:hypothetical protein